MGFWICVARSLPVNDQVMLKSQIQGVCRVELQPPCAPPAKCAPQPFLASKQTKRPGRAAGAGAGQGRSFLFLLPLAGVKPRQSCSSLGKALPFTSVWEASGTGKLLLSPARGAGQSSPAAAQAPHTAGICEFLPALSPLLSLWRGCHLLRWNSSPGSHQECQGWEM